MVNFVKKRLQVFVSSTYTDLIQERQAAVEAILTAGHIPAGMELFTSGDESQLEVINQWIDESDIYLLILGGRYGSVESKTGKSYTHLEYEYALSQNKPLFACVIKEDAIDKKMQAHGREVIEMKNPQKLEEFRNFVSTKMVRFWEDSKDIKITVSETLAHFARREDLIGWVRSCEEANIPALADEIARLSKENAQLRSQLEKNGTEDTINGLSFDELKAILEHKKLLDFFEEQKSSLNLGALFQRTLSGAVVGMSENDAQKLESLCELGLVLIENNKSRLSDAGRIFLNKLDLWKFKQQNL